MVINGIKVPSKRRKPRGKPKGQWGWYELRKSLLTFFVSAGVSGAGIAMWALNAAGSVINADNVSAMAHQDGLIAAAVSAAMGVIHFVYLLRTNNTGKQ